MLHTFLLDRSDDTNNFILSESKCYNSRKIPLECLKSHVAKPTQKIPKHFATIQSAKCTESRIYTLI